MDKAFADVSAAWDAWCRIDVSDTELLDILIAHGVADHAEIDRLEAVIAKQERELTALHATMRGAAPAWWETALGAALIVQDRLRARWGRLWGAATGPNRHEHTARWLVWYTLICCCVAVYVRFGR